MREGKLPKRKRTAKSQKVSDNMSQNEKMTYAPMAYLFGSKALFPALETAIESAEIGKEVTITIPCEDAAGARNPKLIELTAGTSEGFEVAVEADKVVVTEAETCKFDQNWAVAKYKIVADLRSAFGVQRVEFVQVWDSGKKEDKKE